MATSESVSTDLENVDPVHVRFILAELASEMLRLQLDPHAEPKRVGIFAPEELRRWTTLPSSALASDGRSDAAKACKADDTAASLRAELVTQRGRHEEEKRQLLEMLQDLQLWNAELENSSDEGDVERKFGSRIRGLAQRLKSPYPRGILDEAEEILRFSEDDDEEINQSTLSFGESREAEMTPRLSLINSHKENPSTPGYGESSKVIAALEEQLHLTEQRAAILEKRLQIVKESGDAVIQSLNEELADVADDRARSEAAMIKEISNLDAQRRAERLEYEARIQDWIAHDKNRKAEMEEYEMRIESLLGTVRVMNGLGHVETSSSSWDDKEAEKDMYHDIMNYIQLLQGNSLQHGKGKRSLIMSINDAFDLEFNANPTVADRILEYYRTRPELKDFTLKSELPRMNYEVIFIDEKTGKDVKLVSTDDIRSYFTSLEQVDTEDNIITDDEEVDIILRAANQSLLADPMAMLTCEGNGKLVHSGNFHSTLIATVCSFKLDLRRKGQRRVTVQCELAICVPSGSDGTKIGGEAAKEGGNDEKISATLELARAHLVIQFSPSPTATPSGPLVKYSLSDIKPTIKSVDEGSDTERAILSAASVLARDRYSNIQNGGQIAEVRQPIVKGGMLSRLKTRVVGQINV
jgi:hypothetical protein